MPEVGQFSASVNSGSTRRATVKLNDVLRVTRAANGMMSGRLFDGVRENGGAAGCACP